MLCSPELGTFRTLAWGSTFERFSMVAIETIGDGNCFFHALVQAFYIPYRTQKIGETFVSRKHLVQSLRRSLALRLGESVDPLFPEGPTHYDLLSRGKLSEFAQALPEYSFEAMQQQLASDSPVGNEFNEFVSNQLRKDLYLLDANTKDMYITGNDDEVMIQDRDSIVLLYTGGHYELVGLYERGKVYTHFKPTHPFIRFLRARMHLVRRNQK